MNITNVKYWSLPPFHHLSSLHLWSLTNCGWILVWLSSWLHIIPSEMDVINLASPLLRHHFLVIQLLACRKEKNMRSLDFLYAPKCWQGDHLRPSSECRLPRVMLGGPSGGLRILMLASTPEHTTVLKLLSEKQCSGSLATTRHMRRKESLSSFLPLLQNSTTYWLVSTSLPWYYSSI